MFGWRVWRNEHNTSLTHNMHNKQLHITAMKNQTPPPPGAMPCMISLLSLLPNVISRRATACTCMDEPFQYTYVHTHYTGGGQVLHCVPLRDSVTVMWTMDHISHKSNTPPHTHVHRQTQHVATMVLVTLYIPPAKLLMSVDRSGRGHYQWTQGPSCSHSHLLLQEWFPQ